MRERDLAWARPGAAADEAGVADGVVRGTKRACADQGRVGWQHAGYGVDLGHFQRLVHAQAGQDAGQGLGNEGLAGAGRAAEQDVVSNNPLFSGNIQPDNSQSAFSSINTSTCNF